MELSIREVATILQRSPRTVRAQVARGEIPGRKKGGRWRVPSHTLPLTEIQRQDLQTKANGIRQAVETVLPPRTATSRGSRGRSVTDLEAFRSGARILRRLREPEGEKLPAEVRGQVGALLEEALLDLADAVHQYERGRKLEAVNRARSRLARAVGTLLLAGAGSPEEPILGRGGAGGPVPTIERRLQTLGKLARRDPSPAVGAYERQFRPEEEDALSLLDAVDELFPGVEWHGDPCATVGFDPSGSTARAGWKNSVESTLARIRSSMPLQGSAEQTR